VFPLPGRGGIFSSYLGRFLSCKGGKRRKEEDKGEKEKKKGKEEKGVKRKNNERMGRKKLKKFEFVGSFSR